MSYSFIFFIPKGLYQCIIKLFFISVFSYIYIVLDNITSNAYTAQKHKDNTNFNDLILRQIQNLSSKHWIAAELKVCVILVYEQIINVRQHFIN